MALSKIEICRKIVTNRQFKKVKGRHGMIILDMFTASCLITLYEKMTTDENRKKFEDATWEGLANYIYKKLGK